MRSRVRVLLSVIALAAMVVPGGASASKLSALDKAVAAIGADRLCDPAEVHADSVSGGHEETDLRIRKGARDTAKDPNSVAPSSTTGREPPPPPGGGVQGGNIPVYFHVIQDSNGDGNISDAVIAEQIDVMNAAFDFSTLGAGESWTFTLAQTTHTLNAQWYRATPGSGAETQMKNALHEGSMDDLNVYTGINNGSLLGWATFPTKAGGRGGANTKDGVVIANDSVPGGGVPNNPYNEGDTLVHEVGHWMGLYHTFQGGCTGTGDSVADTPAEAQPAFGCPIGRNSCLLQAGDDPIHNFMDYSDDFCMFEFTPGQDARMDTQYSAFRLNK
ncbi:MAG: zinc metalloprotease [Actinomycetota bacterium]